MTQTHRRPWTLFGSFFARSRTLRVRRKSPRRRLVLEPLEDRTLLSASIFGSVWNDLLPDAVRQSEPGLAAVTVYLDDGSQTFNGSQPSVLTNGAGDYSFTGLSAGTYIVRAVLPDGAAFTSPTPGQHQVTLAADGLAGGVDFGVQVTAFGIANEGVTSDPGVQQMPSVAVNPNDANHVVMAYMDYSLRTTGYAGIGVSVSHDGGATFQKSSIPLPANFDQAAGQPTVVFDGSGAVYVSFMAATFLGKDGSKDLKPGLTYDTATETVTYLGNRVVSRRSFGMTANNGVFVARSDDGGLTWATPVAVSAQRYDLTATTSSTAVAAPGTVVITPVSMPADLFVGKALIIDEGTASQERVTVTAFTGTSFTAVFAKTHAAGFKISTPVTFEALPDLSVDRNEFLPNGQANPNYGNLYAVWTRFYPATQYPGRPASTAGTDIMLAVSRDGGLTWQTQLQNLNGVMVSTIKDPVVGNSANASTGTEGGGLSTLPRVTVGPEGDLYVSMFAGGRFPVFHSTDAGATFINPNPSQSNPLAATGYPLGTDFQTDSIYPAGASVANFIPRGTLFNNSFRTQSVRSIVADPARPGYVYAVEATQIITIGTTTTIDSGEIAFSYSTDHGLTWTRTFTVGANLPNLAEFTAGATAQNLAAYQARFRTSLNDDNDSRALAADTTLADEVISGQALPQLSVDEQGNILVIWYDTRRDPANHSLDVFGTVSTDGGKSFSANYRVTDTTFDPNTGVFRDARNVNSFYLGDRIGLAVANGTAYAAWTDTRQGNQEVFFGRYDLTPAPLPVNDRFEANDTPATATDLGKVTAQRLLPQLSLTGSDNDWFKVEAGATGDLIITATAAVGGSGIQLELCDENGTPLAQGTNVTGGGQILGQQVSFRGLSGQKYLVHVKGGLVPAYTLALQSLTADLGTTVHATADGSINSGGQAVYRVVSAVGGSLEFTLTSGSNVSGNLNLQVLSADGQTVLASGTLSGTAGPGEVEKISLAVDAGQIVLVRVSGSTGSSGSFHLDVTGLDLFQTSQNSSLFFSVVGSPSGVTTADMNGDDIPDLVVSSNLLSDSVNVLLGAGDGTFQAARRFDVGPGQIASTAREPVVADFNGDDIPDVAVTNYHGDSVSILLGRGDGTYAPERRYDATFQADSLAAGDFDGDGKVDLAALARVEGQSRLAILSGRGDGSFEPPVNMVIPFDRLTYPVRAADLNGDNRDDLVVFGNNAASFQVLLSNGDRTFTVTGTIQTGETLFDGQLADVNGDGRADVIVAGANSGTVFVHHGNGDGSFQNALALPTLPVKPGDNLVVIGLTVTDYGSAVGSGLGAADGLADLVVTVKSRLGSDPPQLLVLPGLAGGGFASARKLATLNNAGRVAAADLNGDRAIDLSVVDAGGVRVFYGKDPVIAGNATPQTARALGPVTHFLGAAQAIVPGFQDAYYSLTVPTDPALGSGDQVLDFSAHFDFVQGAGLQMEVLDAGGTQVLGSGSRFRIRAAQGARLLVHVFGLPAAVGQTAGAGTYVLDIDVLPQVVSVEAQSLLPGTNGPSSSLVITLQGDRLDRATAENPNNYTVTWFGPDGMAGTADDQVLIPATLTGGQPVVYSAGTNVAISAGRTNPDAVRQTVTLMFDRILPVGSYQVELSAAIQTAAFNDAESGLLAPRAGFTGHPVVTGPNQEGAVVQLPGLIAPAGAPGNFESFPAGNAWLSQLHDDLSALLDANLARLGDDPSITTTLLQLVLDKIGPTVLGGNTSFLIIVGDPVSIDVVDPKGDRAQVDLKTDRVVNTQSRTFIEAGGNVEVMVLAGVSGTYTLNLSDVQATARAGAVLVDRGQVALVSLTDAVREGQRTFTFEFGDRDVAATPTGDAGGRTVSLDVRASGTTFDLTGVVASAGTLFSLAPAVGPAASLLSRSDSGGVAGGALAKGQAATGSGGDADPVEEDEDEDEWLMPPAPREKDKAPERKKQDKEEEEPALPPETVEVSWQDGLALATARSTEAMDLALAELAPVQERAGSSVWTAERTDWSLVVPELALATPAAWLSGDSTTQEDPSQPEQAESGAVPVADSDLLTMVWLPALVATGLRLAHPRTEEEKRQRFSRRCPTDR